MTREKLPPFDRMVAEAKERTRDDHATRFVDIHAVIEWADVRTSPTEGADGRDAIVMYEADWNRVVAVARGHRSQAATKIIERALRGDLKRVDPAPAQPVHPEPLDEAWAEAEAALPEGWWVHMLHAWSFDDMAYRAEAVAAGHEEYISTLKRDKPYGTRRYVSGPSVDAYGPTPAAALHALAERLRGREGRE